MHWRWKCQSPRDNLELFEVRRLVGRRDQILGIGSNFLFFLLYHFALCPEPSYSPRKKNRINIFTKREKNSFFFDFAHPQSLICSPFSAPPKVCRPAQFMQCWEMVKKKKLIGRVEIWGYKWAKVSKILARNGRGVKQSIRWAWRWIRGGTCEISIAQLYVSSN